MDITTLCAVVAALRVLPNRSQFFQYESVSLSCGQQGSASDWRVKKNTSTHMNKDCSTSRDGIHESSCFIDALYPSDTGVYWCESAEGGCSDAASITVTGGSVILESPVLPVMEGDAVTLRCTNRKSSSSSPTADFYKDGLLIRSSSTGNMTIHSVSESDEGLYMCNISGAGQSPDSWLEVRGGVTVSQWRPDPSNSPATHVVLPVVVACLSLVSLMLLCLWRSHKGKADPDVSYTDVIITQEVQPQRVRDAEAAPTFYSTVKPGNT
ncbi:low affinity immunoglobulin gamma Fc region receptor II-like isoform X2 [Chelmon rostratus]|uniref:low affinity immunoglobulin gamma Fc region receptor II-like isoform X2 n=1 Tax=Chelmon rostratus TaxID=109905 RepID=UPI001BEAFFCC|nr:low affinity immunoglobulin gamma Fc region receptor II-like isoform X2 [Chelmon rostratus]